MEQKYDTRVGKNIICTNSKKFLNKYGIYIEKHARVSDIFERSNDSSVITITLKNKVNIFVEDNTFNIEVFRGIKKITHIKIINYNMLDINLENGDYYIFIKYKRIEFVADDNIINNTWR